MIQIDENSINSTSPSSSTENPTTKRKADPKKRDRKKDASKNSDQPEDKKEKDTSSEKKNDNKKNDNKKKSEEKKSSDKKKEDKKAKEDKSKKKSEKTDKTEKKEKSEKKEKAEKKVDSQKNEEKTLSKEEIATESTSDTSYITTDSISLSDTISNDSIITLADSSSLKTQTDTAIIVPYMSGNEPIARINHPGHDSGIMTLIAITFILVSFSYKYYRRMLSTYGQDLWNVRNRANAFDEHTSNEHSVIAILIFQLCVYAGILISAKLNTIIPINPDKIMLTTCCMMGTYGLFYLFQLAIYSIVGYVFTDKNGATQWIKGFNASHIFLGFSLIIPTMLSIFYPTTTGAMIVIATILYVIARLTFIFKGFRIFYKKVHSLFYFILYLCTLEIIPIIFAYGIAQIIFNSLQ